jgi:hypothetical protein
VVFFGQRSFRDLWRKFQWRKRFCETPLVVAISLLGSIAKSAPGTCDATIYFANLNDVHRDFPRQIGQPIILTAVAIGKLLVDAEPVGSHDAESWFDVGKRRCRPGLLEGTGSGEKAGWVATAGWVMDK